jgi:hypothetical protein
LKACFTDEKKFPSGAAVCASLAEELAEGPVAAPAGGGSARALLPPNKIARPTPRVCEWSEIRGEVPKFLPRKGFDLISMPILAACERSRDKLEYLQRLVRQAGSGSQIHSERAEPVTAFVMLAGDRR